MTRRTYGTPEADQISGGAGYSTLDDWQAENVTVQADGTLAINVSNSPTVFIEDHAGIGETFVESVMDSILF